MLLGNEELLMTLSAKDSNSENEGKSALVMQLPTPANGRTLRFSESYYVANYPEDGKSDIELETPIEFLNSENELDVQIQLVSKLLCIFHTYYSQKSHNIEAITLSTF